MAQFAPLAASGKRSREPVSRVERSDLFTKNAPSLRRPGALATFRGLTRLRQGAGVTAATPVRMPAPRAQTNCAGGAISAAHAALDESQVPIAEKGPADAVVVVLAKTTSKIAAAAPFRCLLRVFMVIPFVVSVGALSHRAITV